MVDLETSFQPADLRVPLRFGSETVTTVIFARVRVVVENRRGRIAEGWGESPLNAGWAWPSPLSHRGRTAALERFCTEIATAWLSEPERGHAMELGHRFIEHRLAALRRGFNAERHP